MRWGSDIFILTFILILICAGVLISHLVSQRNSERQFMDGPYQIRLLYVQTCTIGNTRDETPITTIQEEIAYCNRMSSDGKAGYYVYDFNIRDSLYLENNLINTIMENDLLSFPDSLYKGVTGGSNKLNMITPLTKFTDFEISCQTLRNFLKCTIDDDVYLIPRVEDLDLILPQGIVWGPDWYKILKSGFFPFI